MKTEAKVGVFVFVGLVVVGLLLLNFSKGGSLFSKTYVLKLQTTSGIKSKAAVAILGFPVGTVGEPYLDLTNRTVTVDLIIDQKYRIRKGSKFSIEQAGFLGDQYVAVKPAEGNDENFHQPGDIVTSDEPFNILEMARSASGLLEKVDSAVMTVNEMMGRLDKLVLNEETLTNLSVSVKNLRHAAEKADGVVSNVQFLVKENTEPIGKVVENLSLFSDRLDKIANEVEALIVTNKQGVANSVKNLEDLTANAKEVVKDVKDGSGIFSDLIKNQELKTEFSKIVANLQVASSNIATYGLLFKPNKPKRFKDRTDVIYQGRSPFKK